MTEKEAPQDILTYMIALPPVQVLERLQMIGEPPSNVWNYVQQHGIFDTRANPPFWITVQGNEFVLSFPIGDVQKNPTTGLKGIKIEYFFRGKVGAITGGTLLTLYFPQFRRLRRFQFVTLSLTAVIGSLAMLSALAGESPAKYGLFLGIGLFLLAWYGMIKYIVGDYTRFFIRRQQACRELLEEIFAGGLIEEIRD